MRKEQKRRSFVKAISYRFGATLATFSVAFLFTGNIELATSIGLVDTIVKFILFYINERFWMTIKWGYIPVVNSIDSRPKNKNYEPKTTS